MGLLLLLLLLMLLAQQAVRVGVIKLGSTVDAGVRLVLLMLLVLLLPVLIVCGISRTAVARTRQTIFYRGLRLVGLEQPH